MPSLLSCLHALKCLPGICFLLLVLIVLFYKTVQQGFVSLTPNKPCLPSGYLWLHLFSQVSRLGMPTSKGNNWGCGAPPEASPRLLSLRQVRLPLLLPWSAQGAHTPWGCLSHAQAHSLPCPLRCRWHWEAGRVCGFDHTHNNLSTEASMLITFDYEWIKQDSSCTGLL